MCIAFSPSSATLGCEVLPPAPRPPSIGVLAYKARRNKLPAEQLSAIVALAIIAGGGYPKWTLNQLTHKQSVILEHCLALRPLGLVKYLPVQGWVFTHGGTKLLANYY